MTTITTAPRLVDLLPQWVSWLKVKGHRPRGVATYRKELDYLIAGLGGDAATTADLTWERLQLHLADLAEREMSAASIGKRVAAARSFGTWLRKAGHIEHNAALDLDAPKRAKGLPRPLTSSELRGLWSLMQTPIELVSRPRRWAWQRNMRLLALGLLAGLRLSEIGALKWRDVDLEAGTIRVVSGKGDRDRLVPIAAQLQPFLEAVPEAERLGQRAVAGRTDGKCYSYKSVCHVMDRFVRLALPDVSMHRLRHHFASSLYAAGADLFALQDLLGHASPETTRIYARVSTEHTRAAIAKLPDFGTAAAPANVGGLVARYAVARNYAPLPPITCLQCGAVAPASRPDKQFCSPNCSRNYRRAQARQKGNAE